MRKGIREREHPAWADSSTLLPGHCVESINHLFSAPDIPSSVSSISVTMTVQVRGYSPFMEVITPPWGVLYGNLLVHLYPLFLVLTFMSLAILRAPGVCPCHSPLRPLTSPPSHPCCGTTACTRHTRYLSTWSRSLPFGAHIKFCPRTRIHTLFHHFFDGTRHLSCYPRLEPT